VGQDEEILVRDTKIRDASGANASPVLGFTPEAWRSFLGRVRAGNPG
jgi:hypothetical protein